MPIQMDDETGTPSPTGSTIQMDDSASTPPPTLSAIDSAPARVAASPIQRTPVPSPTPTEPVPNPFVEDYRRVKSALGAIPDAVKSGANTVKDFTDNVGGFLSQSGGENDPLHVTPKPVDPDSISQQMDGFLARPVGDGIRAIAHGVMPETFDPPPAAPPVSGPITELTTVKDAAMRPVVGALRSLQRGPGRDVAEFMLQRTPGTPAVGENSSLDALEYLARIGFSFIGGNEVQWGVDEKKTRDAINSLEASPLGVTGTAAVSAMAQQIGELPLYLLGTGRGAAAVAAEKEAIMGGTGLLNMEEAVPKLAALSRKEATVEGLAQGTIQTLLTPGQDVVTGPLAGAVFGHLISGLNASKTAQGELMNRHAAVMPAETWDGFKTEINQLVEDRNRKAVQFVGDENYHPIVSKVEPTEDFEPTYATIGRDESGKLVGKEVEIKISNRAPYAATVAVKESPIDTYVKAREWTAKVNENGMTPQKTTTTKEGGRNFSEWIEKVYNPRFITETGTGVPLFEKPTQNSLVTTPEFSPPEEALRYPNVAAKVKGYLEKTPLQLAKSGVPTDSFPTILQVDNAERRQEGVARLVASIINPGAYKPSATWKLAKGDLVTTPTGESRVVGGFSKDGKVYARKIGSGGRGSVFGNEDLRFVSDTEGMVPGKMGPHFMDDKDIEAALNPLERLTIPRAAAALNMDPSTAASVIRKMTKDGRLVSRGNGVWDVKSRLEAPLADEPWGTPPEGPRNAVGNRPKGDMTYPALVLPGEKQPIQEGLEVLFGVDSHGNGLKGVLRGPDPANPRHYILEVPKEGLVQQLEAKGALTTMPGTNLTVARSGKETYFKSVPQEALKSVIPVNMAKRTLQQIIDVPGQYGFNLPHPPGYVVTTSNFQTEVNKVQSIINNARTPTMLGSKKLGLMKQAVESQILNAYYLTPPMLRRAATPLYGAMASARETMLRASERLKHGVGSYGSQADRDLIPVIEAAHANGMKDVALANWATKYPEEASDVMRTLTALLNERKENSDWLGQRGIKSIDMLEQMRGAGEEPEYVTMMYNTHVLKERYPDWVKKNTPQIWQNAVDYLTAGTRSAQDVEGRLASFMRQSDPGIALAKSGMVDKATASKIIARKDIPAPLEALLGPVPSASLRLGHTVGYQRALRKTIETWDNIAASEWWVPDTGTRKQFADDPSKWSSPRADLQVPVPDRPEFGAAAGGWTHKSLTNFVTKPPMSTTNGFLKMMGFLGGKWKAAHTVYGGPAPWVNNVVRNLKGVVLSGAYEGPEDAEGFRRAPGLLLAYRDNPSTLGPAAIVVEAKQFSALSAGFAGAEIHDARNRIQDELFRAMNRAAGKSNSMEDMVMSAQEFMRTKQENVKDAYDAIDQYFKLATYLNLRKRFIGQGMSIHDAAALSAERINASYPNFELVGPLIEKMRPLAGFGAGYFMSSKAEDMRINAMLMARVARTLNPMTVNQLKLKEPDLLLRLAAAGAMTYGATAMMQSLRRSNGISDQDIEKADSAVSLKAKGWSPASVYGWDYDDKGRLVRYDLSPMEDAFMMLRGNTQDPVLARMFHNTVLDLVGEGTWAGRGWTSASNATGLITQAPPEPRPVGYAEGGPLNFMQQYAEMGGVPQAPLRLSAALQRGVAQPMNPAMEQWTPSEVFQKAIGVPIAGPVGDASMLGTILEGKGQIKGLQHEIKKVPRRIGVDEPRQDYLLNAKVQGLEGVANRIGQVQQPPSSIKMDK